MGFLKNIVFRELEKFVVYYGYSFLGQTGSHMKYRNSLGYLVVIPKHKIIKRGTLNDILKVIAHKSGREKNDVINDFLEFLKIPKN